MDTTKTTRTVIWLGTTDEVTTCDCCRRSDLKKTVALMVNDFPVYYGSECAAKALGMTSKAVKRETAKADGEKFAARLVAICDAGRAAFRAGDIETYKRLNSEVTRIQCSPCRMEAIRFPEGF
jgi:hypothetical protein